MMTVSALTVSSMQGSPLVGVDTEGLVYFAHTHAPQLVPSGDRVPLLFAAVLFEVDTEEHFFLTRPHPPPLR